VVEAVLKPLPARSAYPKRNISKREIAMRPLILAAVAATAIVSFSAIAPAAEQPMREGQARAVKPAGSYDLAQECGWYAIFQCAKSRRVGGPGRVIWTSDFPNFRPGWFCRVMGPFSSRVQAVDRAEEFGGYAKSAC
jgi:hypothetical protein